MGGGGGGGVKIIAGTGYLPKQDLSQNDTLIIAGKGTVSSSFLTEITAGDEDIYLGLTSMW